MGAPVNFYPSLKQAYSFLSDSLSMNYIQPKVSQAVKKIFRYLVQNQQAIAIAISSYACIEAGRVIAASLNPISIDQLESCQSMFCEHWDTTNKNSPNPDSFLEFRCNSTHSNYHPFSSIENCIKDLCDYMKANKKNLAECSQIPYPRNITFENEDIVLESKIWKALCPKLHLRHSNPSKKLKAIHSCIQNLCNYFNTFSEGVSPLILKFCKSSNQHNLNHLLHKLTRAIDEIENKLKENDFWTRTSSIASAVGGVLGIVSSLVALGITILTYKVQVRNADINPVILNLKNIIPSITETNTLLRIENAQNTVENRRHTEALDTLLSEVQGLTVEVSEIFEHVVNYREEAEELPNSEENPAGELMGGVIKPLLGTFGPIKLPLDMEINHKVEVIRKEGTETLKKLGVKILEPSLLDPNRIEEGMTQDSFTLGKRIFKSVVLPGQTFSVPESLRMNSIIQPYLDDYISGNWTDYTLTKIQANRLNGTFENWDRAFCTYNYPDILFCRYPNNNDTTPGTLLPTHYTNAIAQHNLPGICYILLGDLWCNWTKIFQIFSQTISNYVTPSYFDCPWDLFPLRIESQDSLQVSAAGNCFNRSAIFEFDGV